MENEQSSTYALQKENKGDSGRIIDIEKVEDGLFTIVTVGSEEDNQKCFIAIGNKRITDMQSRKQCEDMIEQKHWGLIMSSLAVVTHDVIEKIKEDDRKMMAEE